MIQGDMLKVAPLGKVFNECSFDMQPRIEHHTDLLKEDVIKQLIKYVDVVVKHKDKDSSKLHKALISRYF